MFELIKPGCGGVVESSLVLEMPDEDLRQVYDRVRELENKMMSDKYDREHDDLEEGSDEVSPLPPSTHNHHEL